MHIIGQQIFRSPTVQKSPVDQYRDIIPWYQLAENSCATRYKVHNDTVWGVFSHRFQNCQPHDCSTDIKKVVAQNVQGTKIAKQGILLLLHNFDFKYFYVSLVHNYVMCVKLVISM